MLAWAARQTDRQGHEGVPHSTKEINQFAHGLFVRGFICSVGGTRVQHSLPHSAIMNAFSIVGFHFSLLVRCQFFAGGYGHGTAAVPHE